MMFKKKFPTSKNQRNVWMRDTERLYIQERIVKFVVWNFIHSVN